MLVHALWTGHNGMAASRWIVNCTAPKRWPPSKPMLMTASRDRQLSEMTGEAC
jgi:hypothetical protein